MFGESGIVPAAFVAILLNIILPKDKDEKAVKEAARTEDNVQINANAVIKETAVTDEATTVNEDIATK